MASTDVTLTQGSPLQTFSLAADDTIQILVSTASNRAAKDLKIVLEVAHGGGYIPIYDVETSKYELKIGSYRLSVVNADASTNIKLVLKTT